MATFLGKALTTLTAFSGRTSVPPRETVGVGGAVSIGGYLVTGERDATLVGHVRWETYADILTNVAIVAAGVRYFLNLIGQPAWKVVPNADAKNAGAAEDVAELVDSILHDMRRPWYRVVRRGALYRFHGYSLQEWTAKKRPDGAIGLLDIAPRPQFTIERWDLEDEAGALLGVTQRAPRTGVEIYLPRAKMVYHVDDSLTDSPEGLGLLRHIVEPARRLRRFETLEHTGFITDLRGVPIGRAPISEMDAAVKNGTMKPEDKASALKTLIDWVTSHVRNEHSGVIFDSSTYRSQDAAGSVSATPRWSAELIQGGSTSLEAINVAVSRLVYDIARVLGVEHLLVGSDGTGSLALSKTKSRDFALTVDSTLTEMVSVMQSDVVTPICDMNGIPDDLRPTLATEAIQMQDVSEITAALRDLATAGAPLSSGDEAIDEIRALMGLSPAPDDLGLDEEDASLLAPKPGEPGSQEDEAVRGEGDKGAAPPDPATKKRRIRR